MTMTRLSELFDALDRGGDAAHEAALTLGLLLERGVVRRPADDDGGVDAILGPEWESRHLSREERRTVVDRLIAYIGHPADPHPMAVWALSKSADQRALAPLLSLLDRTVADRAKEHLAYQALVGIATIGARNPDADAAIARAAREGHGQVKETARQQLQIRQALGKDGGTQ